MTKIDWDKYDTVVFDLDGVITTEENYWNAAALTVYEYLYPEREINPDDLILRVSEIRKHLFCDDKMIAMLKNKGVNSNWDLGFITVIVSIITGSRNPEEIMEYAAGIGDNIIDEFDKLAQAAAEKTGKSVTYYTRNGQLWKEMQDEFQSWYFGDAFYCEIYGKNPAIPGKSGLVINDKPIVDLDKLKDFLLTLGKSKRLCIATGRPYVDFSVPFKAWGIYDMFAADGLGNYDLVVEAEKKRPGEMLTKPNPYMLLKAVLGTDYPDEDILEGNYDKEKARRTLVVGDAGSDIYAARAMGSDFCAILMGINGKKARGFFEELNSEYICNSIFEMI